MRAIPIAAVTYGTALLAGVVAESLDIKGFWNFAFVTGAIVAFVGVVIMLTQAAIAAVESLEAEKVRHAEALNSAYEFADKWMIDDLKLLAAVSAGRTRAPVLAPADPLAALEHLVESAYEALTAHFGKAAHTEDRIDFEVTFMTRSFIDDGITIAAWANRDGRKPTSMKRRGGNPAQYDRTETAGIYRAFDDGGTAEMRIVSDTKDPHENYAELYDRQLQRIRSSVIYPVVSSDYGLIGALVLHCDRANFFKEQDRKYWRQFCEVFAKPIALEKQLLDHSLKARGDEELGPAHWTDKPF